jgi:hypothetical protein
VHFGFTFPSLALLSFNLYFPIVHPRMKVHASVIMLIT